VAGSLWSWACKGGLLRTSRLIITALVATLAIVACRTNVTMNIQPSSKPAVGLDPLTDVDQLKAFLRLRFQSYPIKPEHLDLILSAANEVIGANLTKEQTLWSPEDIGLILTRLVEKAKLPGVLEAQSLRVSFALTAVTGLNDFVGGIIIDSCSRVTYSSSMGSHLGKLFESLLMKSRQLEEFAPQVYQELILIRGGHPPSNCRKTLRYATARSLISGAKDGGMKTPALVTIVSAFIKEEIRLARLAGVSATALGAGLSVWENRVLDNNESLSGTNGLVDTLKTSVENTASDDGVIAVVTPIPEPEPEPVKDVSGDARQVGEFCGGLGVADWPYKICNLATLKNIAIYPEASFVLTNNIDASPTVLWDEGAGWTPLGNTSRPFSGSLDGQGYRISGLTINRPPMIDVGFIGYASASSVLKNVRFENIAIQGMTHVGGAAGRSLGTIQNVSVNGSVRGVVWVGGLIGYFLGDGTTPASITDCNANDIEVSGKTHVGGIAGEMTGGASLTRSWSSGTVTGHPAEGVIAGGLLGRLSAGTVSRSHSTATVSANSEVGGLIGRIFGTSICLIEYSYASGSVTARGTTGLNQGFGAGVGGLVGVSGGECLRVKKSYATGNVTSEHATGAVLGGLVGALNWGGNSIEDSYATGNLTTASTGGAAGGLVGSTHDITIFRSYATGAVNSPNSSNTGGLVGGNGSMGIYNSFSTGVVAGPTGGNRGGFLGAVHWSTITNSYWLKPSGSLFTCLGTGFHPGCTELSDSRFLIQAGGPLFSTWDFNTVWYFPPSGGLPLLRD
jgi:hypothetical protein